MAVSDVKVLLVEVADRVSVSPAIGVDEGLVAVAET